MSMFNLTQSMFDHTVRLEAAWPFPNTPASGQLADALENLECLPPELDALTKGWDEDERCALFDGNGPVFQLSWEELCASAVRRSLAGWIGVAACPVFNPINESSVQFSWGYYNWEVIFAETADGLLAKAIDWAKARHRTALASWRADQ